VRIAQPGRPLEIGGYLAGQGLAGDPAKDAQLRHPAVSPHKPSRPPDLRSSTRPRGLDRYVDLREPYAGPNTTSSARSSVTSSNRCSSPAGTKITEPGPTSAAPPGVTILARPAVTT
jgi:hypothetical protein